MVGSHQKLRRLQAARIAGASLSLAFSGVALSQVNLVDQTRSLSTAFENYVPTKSDSTTASGPYSNNLVLSGSVMVNVPVDDSYLFSYDSTAGQTSSALSTGLSANSSSSASSSIGIIEGLAEFSINASSQSLYTVDFTVNTPSNFSIAGSMSESCLGHGFNLGTAEVILSTSLQASPIYSVSGTAYNDLAFYQSQPISFSTILEPGQTYELSASAVTSSLSSDTAANGGEGEATFNFTASVPEPGSLFILPSIVFLGFGMGRFRMFHKKLPLRAAYQSA